ncbi:MAG: DUF420 domain-containing protein [Candidatus Marinimicrobia bacterium]|nr:DUF420 domain-containing protein [Candidatus Neomarinimicrobiota bacterium]
MTVSSLPLLNASLNGLCAALLATAYYFIRHKQINRHRNTMLAAVAVSVVFLFSYITYHYIVGVTTFPGQGPVRGLYFAVLLTHTVLAVSNVPLVIITLRAGLGGRFRRHRKIARWTLPIWFYISVTGVLIYLMLYQFDYS